MSLFLGKETDVMSKTDIKMDESGVEKAVTYSFEMKRYKLATEQEFYFEARRAAGHMAEGNRPRPTLPPPAPHPMRSCRTQNSLRPIQSFGHPV